MILRLEKKTKKKKATTTKMKDFGFLEEIEEDIDSLDMKPIAFPPKSDYVVPTNSLETGNDANNGRNIIHMDRLFGSHKPYGVLPVRPHKQHFSHKRIFDPITGKIAMAKEDKELRKANSH